MGNNERTGFSGQTVLPPLHEDWHFDIQGDPVSSPVVYGGMVYTGARNGSVYALDAKTGELIWDYSTDGFIDATPYVTSTSVIVPSMDSTLYCFDRFNGNIIWRSDLGAPSVSSPLVLDGKVYLGAGDPENAFKAFDAETGNQVFSVPVGQPVYSAPSTDGTLVYFGANDGKIYAVNKNSGAVIPEFPYQFTGGAFNMNSVVYSSGVLYSLPGHDERRLFKTKTSDGSILSQTSDLTENLDGIYWNWQRVGSPLLSTSTVFVAAGSADYYLIGINRNDMSEVKVSSVDLGRIGDTGILPSPAMANDMLFTGTPDARFLVISSTGGFMQEIILSTSVYSTPAISAGRVFIGMNGGRLIVYKAAKYLSFSAPDNGEVINGAYTIKADMLDPDATGYLLRYAPDDGGENFVQISSGAYGGSESLNQTLASWNTSSLQNGVYLLELDLLGDSAAGRRIYASVKFRINQRPLPPASLTAADNPNDNGNKIILTWPSSPSSVSEYRVYRTSASIYSLIGSTSTLSYLDSSAVTGTTFTYRVTAFDGWLESGFSNTAASFSKNDNYLNDHVDPSGVNDLRAVPGIPGGSVVLNWTGSGDDGIVGSAYYYSIKYSTYPSFPWDGASVWKSSRAVSGPYGASEIEIVTGLFGGVTYYFALKAYDRALNESPLSNYSTSYGAVDFIAPGPPSAILVSDTPGDKGGRLTLTWSLSADDGAGYNDVYGYKIFRTTQSGVYDYSLYYATAPKGSLGYIDTGATCKFKYFYKVGAYDSTNLALSTQEVSGISANNWRSVDARNGGNLLSDDGAELYIPPNSLNQNDNMIVLKLDPETNQPLASRVNTAAVPTGIVYAVKFEKSATKLNGDAVIKLPYTPSEIAGMNEENLRIYQLSGLNWLLVNSSQVLPDEKKVSARITSLGIYSLMEYKPSGVLIASDSVYTYPNPAKGDSVTFKFLVSDKSFVKIDVYNVAGEKVAELSKPDCPAGMTSEIAWSIRNIASGVYIYRVEASGPSGSKTLTKKMAIVH